MILLENYTLSVNNLISKQNQMKGENHEQTYYNRNSL